MSYWVEIHCDMDFDVRMNAGSDKLGRPQCRSDVGNNPGCKAKDAVKASRFARQQAKNFGWKVDAEGRWLCPFCQTLDEGQNPP